MKARIIFLLLMSDGLWGMGQTEAVTAYVKKSFMIPMRDGVKLFTVMLAPKNNSGAWPILMQRTPYGADFPMKDDDTVSAERLGAYAPMAKEGYIFVWQDIRGKYKSEGVMQIHQPLIHSSQKGAVDESTDTYDAIEWLVKNVPHNNGKAGITGTSYPGWLALVGAVDPHPALKAASEQACMGDLFLGDDFHHQGAFRLSYGMEYSYQIEFDKTTDSHFPFRSFDLYDWYLKLGSLKNVNDKYFHGKIPTWNNFVAHPNYDEFWQNNSPLNYVSRAQIPMLHVGGYYDQEDINGPQLMYSHMEKKDNTNQNFLILGPWNHGQWNHTRADSLGEIAFGSNTAGYFNDLQKHWFDYWLKGIGDGKFPEATCFQTGTNKWETFSTWPPKESVMQKLYAHADGTCSFEPSTSAKGEVSYVSDPARPVPYRALPIEATYGAGSRWYPWQVEDQRFVTTRPDVISFTGDSLTHDLQVTGKILAHVFASTTATDADFVVKLIDVYPDIDHGNLLMSGFQLPVAMEVFRGRFRKSFKHPEPFVPGKPEEIVIDLHQINHTFRRGHHLMIQIQSTWFPVIDRNPQTFVPNIFEAKETDFVKATHTIYLNSQFSTYLEIPVLTHD